MTLLQRKLRIPLPTPAICKELFAAVKAMPDDPAVVAPPDLIPLMEDYLRATKGMSGIGFPIAICVLAVLKGGQYAPMDNKVASGLCNLGVVTEAKAKDLNGKAIEGLVQIYVKKVLPAWHEETQQRTPEEADAYWASHAKEMATES